MNPRATKILRFVGAVTTFFGGVIGGLIYVLDGDRTRLGYWVFMALVCAVVVPLCWRIVGPMWFSMWGFNWYVFEEARNDPQDEQRTRRRR